MTSVQLGPYKLGRQLGAGGFATVHRAVVEGDMGFKRDVAVKVLHPHLTTGNADVVKMLADEARLLARMRHPNIINVQWFGQLEHPRSGPVYVLAMEFVEGKALSSLLSQAGERSEPLPRSVIVDIHTDLAKALAYAHELTDEAGGPLGLVHRDLKPDNVMISSEGTVKLLDFGIARATDRLANATKTDMTRGTVHYMSPEQVRAAKDIDFRSDLFSFGAMFWECLSGRRLIEADSAVGALYEVAAFDPAPALGHVSEILPEAAPVLARLLARDPAERYASTEELVTALEELRRSIEAPQTTRVFLKRLVGRPPASDVPREAGPVAGGASRDEFDLPPTTPLVVSAGASVPPPRRDGAGGVGAVPPTALIARTPSRTAVPGGEEPGATRPMHPAAAEGTVRQGATAGLRGRVWLLPLIGLAVVLVGWVVFVESDWLRGASSDGDSELPGPAGPAAAAPAVLAPLGVDGDSTQIEAGAEDESVDQAVAPVAVAIRPADSRTPTPAPESGRTPTPAPETSPRGLSTDPPGSQADSGPTAAAPSAADARPSPPPQLGPPGRVRIGADYAFDVVIAGKRYTEADARRGISLPPGNHAAQLTCLACPAGTRDALEVTFVVESGQTALKPVQFGEGRGPAEGG